MTTEVVATQVVATLVGSIGLIAAVPLTTALAALLALEEEPEALAELERPRAEEAEPCAAGRAGCFGPYRLKRPSRLTPQLPLPSQAVATKTLAFEPLRRTGFRKRPGAR